MTRYTIADDGTITPPLLTPAEVAEIVAVDQATVRRWVRNGQAPHAGLPGANVRIPAWWVTDRIRAGRPAEPSPASVVVAGEAPAPPSLPASAGGGAGHLRTVPEVAPSDAA